MFLTKKIVVLNGKVSGSVKITKMEKNIEIDCKLSKIASSDWMLAILNNGKIECFKIDDCNKLNFKNSFDLQQDFVCLLLSGNYSEIIARGSNSKCPNFSLALTQVEEKMKPKKAIEKKKIELTEIAEISKIKVESKPSKPCEETVIDIEKVVQNVHDCDCIAEEVEQIPLAKNDMTLNIGNQVDISLSDIIINSGTDNKQPFFLKVQEQVQALFENYPSNTELEDIIKESRWVNIAYTYGYYVLGLICEESSPIFICYGVPCDKKSTVSAEMAKICQWVPLNRNQTLGRGYYMIYQDANTGEILSNQD